MSYVLVLVPTDFRCHIGTQFIGAKDQEHYYICLAVLGNE